MILIITIKVMIKVIIIMPTITIIKVMINSHNNDEQVSQRAEREQLERLGNEVRACKQENLMLKVHSILTPADTCNVETFPSNLPELLFYGQPLIMSIVQEDAERLQRSQSKAPSVLMKSLVEKLKTDLAEKERKQKVQI